MTITDIPHSENNGTGPGKMPNISNEEILALFNKKAQSIAFAFEDEMIALEAEIKAELEKNV